MQYFQPGQPNGARKQNVAAFHVGTSGKPGLGIKQYDDGGRTKMQFFMCQFIRPARLKSRGLCKQKKIDTFYSLLYDAKSNLPYFNGYHKTVIRLEENLDTIGAKKFWQISEEKGNKKTFLAETERIPKGSSLATVLRIWKSSNPICSKKAEMLLENDGDLQK